MTEQELKELRTHAIEKMQEAYNNYGIEKLYKMMVSIHSTEGSACYNIIDYLNSHDY